MGQLYAVRFKLDDGEHLAGLGLTRRNDKLAGQKLSRMFKKVEVLSMRPVTSEEFDALSKQIKSANASRIPLNELTGGNPSLVLHDPDIVNAQDE